MTLPKTLTKGLIKCLGGNAQIFSELKDADEFIDTGSYILNGLISGNIFGGMPIGKRIVFAGKSTTGKTFFLLNIIDNFLKQNENNIVIFLESEDATTKSMANARIRDLDRVFKDDIQTVEDLQIKIWNIIEWYKKEKESFNGGRLLISLDSVGQMMGNKEYNDIRDKNKIVADQGTRAKEIKACFRSIGSPMAWEDITFLATNHTYQAGMLFPTEEMAGGEGLKFVGDIVVFLGKSKIKDGNEVIGNLIRCKNHKNRFAKENLLVSTEIMYDGGLNRYAGLLDLAEKAGIITSRNAGNKGKQYVYKEKEFPKTLVEETPDEFFTKELLEEINEFVKNNFNYGEKSTSKELVYVIDEHNE